ncbi:MAG: UDP-N-acetylglucosamine 2-epimerase [Candidatus Heimdallarchaeota archaeon]
MATKRVCVVTGTRAEYGLLKPVVEKIQKSDQMALQILVTGMHLLPDFGLTIKEIENDGYNIDAKVPIVVGGDNKLSMSVSIGLGVIAISQSLEILKPDVVVVLGDRFEIFAAAIAASYSGMVLAHLCGGDSPQGGYDEYTRHAITKIAHIHFPMTEKNAERILRMGENPANVHVVGYTSLDTILHTPLPAKDVLFHKYNLSTNKDLLVLVYHSLSTSPGMSAQEIAIILEVIITFDLQCLVVYPNVDPGGKSIVSEIRKYEKSHPDKIKGRKSLPYEDFLGFLNCAKVLVGNSSSGILESPSFHLPVVNIGTRQRGRERAGNVIDINLDKSEIETAVNKALFDQDFLDTIQTHENPYGDGQASDRIVKILEELQIRPELLSKRFHD